MTVSAHTATAKGSGGVDDGKNSGTILNGGTADANQTHMSSPTSSKSLKEIVQGKKVSGSQIIATTGTAYAAGIEKANSSGKLAYNPSSPEITRSQSDTGFVIRSGVANKISSVADLNPIFSGGSDTTSRPNGNIHVPNGIHKYNQSGTWATSIFNAYRNPTSASTSNGGLLQSDGTEKAGITQRGTSVSLATDNAATPTRAIPGEMTLLFNFVTFTTNNLDYSAITG
mgnify:CR=1 FL=1